MNPSQRTLGLLGAAALCVALLASAGGGPRKVLAKESYVAPKKKQL